MTTRRGFLGAMLAACAAPAIVRADSLMRVIPLDTEILLPPDPVKEFLKAADELLAQASVIQTSGHNLLPGDLFTIAGWAGSIFRVTTIISDSSLVLEPALTGVWRPQPYIGRRG